MKHTKPTRTGFTLIEMLVVMAIMILLITLLFPAVSRALARAKQTKCEAQLGSFAKIWTIRYNELDGSFNQRTEDRIYPWLSDMFPDTIGDAGMYICPSDKSNGLDGSKPDSDEYRLIDRYNDYAETDDHHSDITACSYLYEFNAAPCSWWGSWGDWYIRDSEGNPASDEVGDKNNDGTITWAEAKITQLDYGDSYSQKSYDPNYFPVIRCFHHYMDRPVVVRGVDDNGNPDRFTSIRVLNAAVSGRVFMSGAQWEYPLDQ